VFEIDNPTSVGSSRGAPDLDDRRDPHSTTCSRTSQQCQRWIDSHWPHQLLLYGVHSAAGMTGIVLLRAGLVIATFALILSTHPRASPGSSRPGVCTAGAVRRVRPLRRPSELLTFLFLAARYRLVERLPGIRAPRSSSSVDPDPVGHVTASGSSASRFSPSIWRASGSSYSSPAGSGRGAAVAAGLWRTQAALPP
jgi:hypothetical protein